VFDFSMLVNQLPRKYYLQTISVVPNKSFFCYCFNLKFSIVTASCTT